MKHEGTKYRYTLQDRQGIPEGFRVMVGSNGLTPKVVLWGELRQALGLPAMDFGSLREYIVGLPCADLDTLCIGIVNDREGRYKERPAHPVQSLSLTYKAA